MKQRICLKKLRGILVKSSGHDNSSLAATFSAKLMSYGFIPDKTLYSILKTLSKDDLANLDQEVSAEIKTMKGADVIHQPMYPNFPQQVMESSFVELFINAITHYWTCGHWKPEYQKLPRQFAYEKINFRELKAISEEQFHKVFSQLLLSNESLSDEDKKFIEWFIVNEPNLALPDSIPFKENMCIVAGMFLKAKKDIGSLVKTATDVLRIITYLSGGDVSLAVNTKFKSMSRSQRKIFAKLLDRVASQDDINRHRNKWVKLFHNLHIGEYSPRLYSIAKKIRNNQRIETFNSQVQETIDKKNILAAVTLLEQRPSDFARRLDHLLRLSSKEEQRQLVNRFLNCADELPGRIAFQVLGHFNSRNFNERIIFPKGNTQRARRIPALKGKIDPDIILQLNLGLEKILKLRFSKLPSLEKVWLDPQLAQCPIPSQQRSASTGLFSVARGTRLPFGDSDKNTLRFFIYWVGLDLDLSATLHDENFKLIEQISYTHLRSKNYEACHSGDITRAPEGASEFIDITIDKASKFGARYVVMNVFVYNGPTFREHQTCFAGWMTRSAPRSNEIFDEKTVEQKVDLRSNSKNAIPAVFDLWERKAIWCDLSTPRGRWSGLGWGGNNIHANQASIEQTLKSIVEAKAKLSLHYLFKLHAEARGQIVEDKKDANTVFSLNEGITPFDITTIVSEYLV